MKRIALFGIFVAVAFNLDAQIPLEKTYNYSTAVVKFETLGYKYYLMDVPNAQCRIYNMDHSLFKTINCPVPSGYYLSDIKYVSEKMFNTDESIELAYTYYKYVPVSSSYYYIYGSRVVSESGSILVNIDGAQYLFVNKTGENLYKLFAYCFDYSVSPEKVWTNIYGLPGVPVTGFASAEKNIDSRLVAFPNPAGDLVKINYQLPGNISQGILRLFESSGRQVEQFIVDSHINHLEIDVNRYRPGVYHYFVESGSSRSKAEKIIIQ